MKKLFAIVALLAATVLAAVAEDKPTAKAKKAEEPAVITKASLPRYFSKLGLSDSQKKEVYKVRAAYAARIQKLKEEMDAMRLREKEDTEAILSEAQRARLKELRK